MKKTLNTLKSPKGVIPALVRQSFSVGGFFRQESLIDQLTEFKIVVLFLLVFTLLFGSVSTSFAYKQVITAAEIERAGVGRINDILRLTDEWWITTIDGYTWWTSPGGLESYRGQNFKVMIDGQLIPLEIFDTQHLERLPIAITQIDSVVFISSPGIHYGVSTDKGLIHFFTRKPGEGLSIRGTRFGGNESGEPGPWKFVPQYYSENVDRIGPDYSGTVSFETPGGFWSTLAARGQFQFNADSLMLQRLNYIYPYATPRNSHLAFSAAGGFKLLNKEFRYLAGNSTIDEYYFFYIPISNEVPVTGVLNHAGISSVPGGKNGELNYSFSYSQQDFQKYKNAFDWDLDYTATTYYGKIDRSGASKLLEVDYNVGASYRRFEQESEVNFEVPLTWEFYDIYGTFSKQVSPKNYVETNFDVTILDHDLAPKITQIYRYNPIKKLTIEILGSYSSRFVEEDNPIWNIYSRGFGFLQDNSIYDPPPTQWDDDRSIWSDVSHFISSNSETARFELTAHHKYSDSFDWYVGGYFNFEAVRNFSTNNFYLPQSGPVMWNPNQNLINLDDEGKSAGFKLGFTKKWTDKCTHHLAYRFNNHITTQYDDYYYWNNVPHSRITYKFDYRMDKTFSLFVQGTYYSQSQWLEYPAQITSWAGKIRDDLVENLFFVDVSVTKSLFKEKLHLNFRFRNIFEDKLIWHPIGGVNHDLTYNIQAWVLLDQLWNPWKK